MDTISKMKGEVAALKKQLLSNGIKPDVRSFIKTEGDEQIPEEFKETSEKGAKIKRDTDDLSEELADTNVQLIESLTSKVQELESSLEMYKEYMQMKIQEFQDQAERAEATKESFENYREKDFEIESLQSTLDEREAEITKFRSESDRLRVEYESHVSALEATVALQRDEAENAAARITHLEEKWSKTRTELVRMQASRDEATAW